MGQTQSLSRCAEYNKLFKQKCHKITRDRGVGGTIGSCHQLSRFFQQYFIFLPLHWFWDTVSQLILWSDRCRWLSFFFCERRAEWKLSSTSLRTSCDTALPLTEMFKPTSHRFLGAKSAVHSRLGGNRGPHPSFCSHELDCAPALSLTMPSIHLSNRANEAGALSRVTMRGLTLVSNLSKTNRLNGQIKSFNWGFGLKCTLGLHFACPHLRHDNYTCMDKVLRGQGDGQRCKTAPYIEQSPEGWNYDLARGETHKPIHYIALIIGNDKWEVV